MADETTEPKPEVIEAKLLSTPCNTRMVLWQDFLDSLDTDGGHLLILIVGVAGGIVAVITGHEQIGNTIVSATSGALLRDLQSAGSNKRRREITYDGQNALPNPKPDPQPQQ